MSKKKMILYVDANVYAAIRKRAYETEQFRSHVIQSILADALGVKLEKKRSLKEAT